MMVNDKHYENEISSLVTEKLEQTSDVLPVWRNLAALTYKKNFCLKDIVPRISLRQKELKHMYRRGAEFLSFFYSEI